MWDTRVAAPLNMVHFGYGFGAILANLIVRPFLGNKKSYVNATVSSELSSALSTSISTPLDADIRGPYLIGAGLCILIGIGYFVFFIQEQKTKRDKVKKEQASDVSCHNI
jgi:fucose permease